MKPAAVRKRRERSRPPGVELNRVDAGEDFFSTIEYLGWESDAEDPTRDLLSRAISDWARLRNPFLA